jgi:hypothetical protein
MVNAYYKPGSGEFLYHSTIMSKEGYLRDFKNPIASFACKQIGGHVLLLENGEWVEFWGSNGRLDAYHSSLQFGTIGKAWQYVSTRFEDCQMASGSSTNCHKEISV